MFAEHQPQLARLGRADAAGFERIATFVLLTIRQPLRIACADYRLVRSGADGPLFGAKRRGLAYVQEHGAGLLDECEAAYELLDDEDAENVIVNTLMRVPCLGPAKAGFMAQILYGLSGCLDTHNLARFGIGEREFRGRESKRSLKRLAAGVREYNALCRRLGGTEALWDGWCAYVAQRDPVNYPSPDRVSELHLAPLEC